tara:strand:+ start:260 stop:493 length:234 start_codon:yes stop_codon:yes gene_type:complete
MKRLGKILLALSLGSLSPKIFVGIIWFYQCAWVKIDNVEVWFTLTEGLFNPVTQVFTALTTVATIITVITAIHWKDL